MTTLKIVWSAVLDGSGTLCVNRRETQIVTDCDPSPADAAATVLKWWLEDDEPAGWVTNWEHEIDANDGRCFVVIHQPPEFAGCYDVDLKRVIQARACPADPADEALVVAVFDRVARRKVMEFAR